MKVETVSAPEPQPQHWQQLAEEIMPYFQSEDAWEGKSAFEEYFREFCETRPGEKRTAALESMKGQLLARIDVLYSDGKGPLSFEKAQDFYDRLGMTKEQMHRTRMGLHAHLN